MKNNTDPNDTLIDLVVDTVNKKIKKGISSITISGITLTNNEIKDIIKVVHSLENREIFIKTDYYKNC